jgi:hypothetical protein
MELQNILDSNDETIIPNYTGQYIYQVIHTYLIYLMVYFSI